MNLALKNLIISEITCQNWNRSQIAKRRIISEQKAIEVNEAKNIAATNYKLQQQYLQD